MNQRITKLLELIDLHGCDAIYISKPENIFYLSGFTGGADAKLFISAKETCILTDGRYLEQAVNECPEWTLLEITPTNFLDITVSLGIKYKRIAFEAHHLTYAQYRTLDKALPRRWQATENLTEQLRRLKSPEELALLRQSAAISDRVFTAIEPWLTVGTSETELANHIQFLLKKYGCKSESFATIVLTGKNAALPHGQPGASRFAPGDMVTMDYGGFYRHYAGDMTRTVAIGKVQQKLVDYYAIVLEAQMRGLETVKAGVATSEVDKAVRNILAKYHLENFFVHGTGHGIGLEIHEAPRLSGNSTEILEADMVVTVEPGIYIPGWGGIRIEDSVIVTETGHERITLADKSFLVFD